MVLNLFSIFDPSTSYGLGLNWSALVLGVAFVPFLKLLSFPRWAMVTSLMFKALSKEMSSLFGSGKSVVVLVFISMFFLVLLSNLLGLVPYVFTPTSHLATTLSLALPLWLGYYSYGWSTNAKHMLAHLVPQGTPWALMSFMVLIESVSSLIRPLTLAVRLAANMVAGHLLLALMSGAISLYSTFVVLGVVVLQILLVTLELAVAIIQSYVLVILSVLYASEV